jgi:dUTP pyrophosphatase
MELRYHALYEGVPPLEYATAGSACFDLRCHLHPDAAVKFYEGDNSSYASHTGPSHAGFVIEPGKRALVPTGVAFDIPEGYAVLLYNRSSTGLKRGLSLANGVGVIDSDYTDQVYIPLVNLSGKTVYVKHGERLAQAMLVPVQAASLARMSGPVAKKASRDGGFGSTGTV